jgi:hypothetical protein
MDQDLFHLAVTVANAAFTSFRIAAHVPQLIAVMRDSCGARAISASSWVMFAIANLSNAVYALVIAGDWLIFGINLVSTASCASIATVTLVKQRRFDRKNAPAAEPAVAQPSSAAHPLHRYGAEATAS